MNADASFLMACCVFFFSLSLFLSFFLLASLVSNWKPRPCYKCWIGGIHFPIVIPFVSMSIELKQDDVCWLILSPSYLQGICLSLPSNWKRPLKRPLQKWKEEKRANAELLKNRPKRTTKHIVVQNGESEIEIDRDREKEVLLGQRMASKFDLSSSEWKSVGRNKRRIR